MKTLTIFLFMSMIMISCGKEALPLETVSEHQLEAPVEIMDESLALDLEFEEILEEEFSASPTKAMAASVVHRVISRSSSSAAFRFNDRYGQDCTYNEEDPSLSDTYLEDYNTLPLSTLVGEESLLRLVLPYPNDRGELRNLNRRIRNELRTIAREDGFCSITDVEVSVHPGEGVKVGITVLQFNL